MQIIIYLKIDVLYIPLIIIYIEIFLGDPNGAAYPKAPVRDSLVMSPKASTAAAVTLPSPLSVVAGPHHTLDKNVEAQHTIKMTAISTAFKATEPTGTTIITSSQLSATVGPSAATVEGVSPDHNKYLHKKFKRIASTTLEPHVPSTNTVPSRHQAPHDHHVDQTQKNALTNGQHIDNGIRLKESPIQHNNQQSPNPTKQSSFASSSQNTSRSSPHLLQKNNHHHNNNNYNNQHNHNNNISQPHPQFIQNGNAPVTYMPMVVSNKPSAEHQTRPLYYINSSSPGLQDAGQSGSLRSTPDQTVFVDTPKLPQQQQRFQPQIVSQQHQFQQVAPERTMSPSMAAQPQQSQMQSQPQQQQPAPQPASSDSPTPGRYVCPFCQLNCAKPSVLQKHIRAHTNERPYPCELCGFAFKTRSNLYKHRR